MLKDIHLIDDNKMVYVITGVREIDHVPTYAVRYELELVAGWDYISEDSDLQGYVPADRFIDSVQLDHIVVYPLEETLQERIDSEGYKQFEYYGLLPNVTTNK